MQKILKRQWKNSYADRAQNTNQQARKQMNTCQHCSINWNGLQLSRRISFWHYAKWLAEVHPCISLPCDDSESPDSIHLPPCTVQVPWTHAPAWFRWQARISIAAMVCAKEAENCLGTNDWLFWNLCAIEISCYWAGNAHRAGFTGVLLARVNLYTVRSCRTFAICVNVQATWCASRPSLVCHPDAIIPYSAGWPTSKACLFHAFCGINHFAHVKSVFLCTMPEWQHTLLESPTHWGRTDSHGASGQNSLSDLSERVSLWPPNLDKISGESLLGKGNNE